MIEIVKQFQIEGTVSATTPLGNGLINDTFLVKTQETDQPDYVLQRINHHVFKDVELLQHNIEAVTNHLRRKLLSEGGVDVDRKVLRFVPTTSGLLRRFLPKAATTAGALSDISSGSSST